MPSEHITSNANDVAANLREIAVKVGNPTPALEALRVQLSEQEAEVWASEGSALGVHWPPSVDPERKTDSRMLVASGTLRASLTGGGAGEVVGNTLEFGTDVPYGHFHQYGTTNMTARPFLGISPALATRIREHLEQTMGENLR